MKVVSLQNRLIKTSLISSVIAASVALLLFVVISIYQTMQVQDEIMDEISDMLLIADLTSTSGQQIDELSDQFDKELQPMLGQLNHLLQRLDQSLKAEQRFTADASHELRSPLSAIQMRLQLLQRKYPERASDFASMQQDISRGTQTLENLLLLARLDPEYAENLPKTHFALHTVIDEAIQALTPFIKQKAIQIQQRMVVAEHEDMIFANQQLIFTCIRNVLDNAIRYTPEKGCVYITLDKQGQYLQLILENEGQGIDPEVLQHLGERFYRALGTKTQGSGLGLSICRKIIELHHGQMELLPSSYRGLKVVIRLLV